MNAYELTSYSIGEALLFEMHEELKIRKLLENNQNIKDYKLFITTEKTYGIQFHNLVAGNTYYPLGLQAVPDGEFIIIKYINNPSIFINEQNNRLYFDLSGKIINFPRSRDTADGLTDTIIYSTANELNQFLSAIGLKYSTWTIKLNIIK